MAELGRQKIAQWGDPLSVQTKTDCIHTVEIDLGILGKSVICDGWATYNRIYQNMLFLVATASVTTDELKQVASDCLVVAAGAAYATWASTPSPEISVRTAAAYAAAKASFYGCIAGRSIELKTAQEGYWPDWEHAALL